MTIFFSLYGWQTTGPFVFGIWTSYELRALDEVLTKRNPHHEHNLNRPKFVNYGSNRSSARQSSPPTWQITTVTGHSKLQSAIILNLFIHYFANKKSQWSLDHCNLNNSLRSFTCKNMTKSLVAYSVKYVPRGWEFKSGCSKQTMHTTHVSFLDSARD